jgi:chaperone modulatory protein CbpM
MTRYYSETEVVAEIEGMPVMRLRAFVSARCLAPAERAGRLAFAEADLARARLLAELAADFDLDEEAAGVVVSLIDQIHGLRGRLRALGAALAAEPEEVRARIRDRLAGGD